MAAEAAKPTDGAENEAATPKGAPKLGLVIALALVGAVVGGGAGTFVLAPRLFARPAAETAAQGEKAKDAEGGEGADAKKGKAAPGKIFKLDNLVVNPAGSEGTRFLMTTVAFETRGDEADAKLREREIEIRDRVIAILESQTMDALTQPGARDTLKRKLGDAVAPFAGPKARLRVFLPQFVIQ